MVLVSQYVFQAYDEASEFPSFTFFDFYVDFPGTFERFILVHTEKSIQMCLLLNDVEVTLNQIPSRKNSLLQIVLYIAKCSVRLQHYLFVFDFCCVVSVLDFFLDILY